MKLNMSVGLLFSSLVLSACAHMPDDNEKTAFRSLQQEVNSIESKVYGNRGAEGGGIYEQLKYCTLQLHDRVNPDEMLSWSEKIERHTDKDYFADPDAEMKEGEYRLLTEKYKIYRQEALSKKENYELRLKSCQSDLKSFVRRERLRSEQEQVIVENALAKQKNETAAAVAPIAPVTAPVVAAPLAATPSAAPVVAAPDVAPKEVREPATATSEDLKDISDSDPD